MGIQGKIHTQDYIDWLELNEGRYLERYTKPKPDRNEILSLYDKKENNKSYLNDFGYSERVGGVI